MSDIFRHLAAHALDLPPDLTVRAPSLFERASGLDDAMPAFTDEVSELEQTPLAGTPREAPAASPQLPPIADPAVADLTVLPNIESDAAEQTPVAQSHTVRGRSQSAVARALPGVETRSAAALALDGSALDLTIGPDPEAAAMVVRARTSSPARRDGPPDVVGPLQARAQVVTRTRPDVSARVAPPHADVLGEARSARTLSGSPSPASRAQVRASLARPQLAAPPSPDAITISIGRIEVRAHVGSAPSPARPRGASAMSLDAYMRKRGMRGAP